MKMEGSRGCPDIPVITIGVPLFGHKGKPNATYTLQNRYFPPLLEEGGRAGLASGSSALPLGRPAASPARCPHLTEGGRTRPGAQRARVVGPPGTSCPPPGVKKGHQVDEERGREHLFYMRQAPPPLPRFAGHQWRSPSPDPTRRQLREPPGHAS